jgi:hypothetical protein
MSKLTPCNDIENQDNKSKNTSTGRSLPVCALSGNGSGHAQRELKKEGEGDLEHVEVCRGCCG